MDNTIKLAVIGLLAFITLCTAITSCTVDSNHIMIKCLEKTDAANCRLVIGCK